MKSFLLFILISLQVLAQSEAELMQSCRKANLIDCEKLGALYIANSQWEKAYMMGELLCGKDIPMGCTYAGTSLLAQKKVKEGTNFLNKACDRFEPYACRSMARLMKNSDEKLLSYMYFKRACQYGLKEACPKLSKPRTTYSKAGVDFLKKLPVSCADTSLSICQEHLALLNACKEPLTKEDCILLPGELSIYFRGKLQQTEASLSLTSLLAAQKAIKTAPNSAGYSYDLKLVLKNFKPLNSYNYVFGFMKACRKRFGQSSWVTTSLELFPDSYKHLSSRVRANILDYFAKGKQTDCYDPKAGFEAFAVANLDAFNPRHLDVWKTNQDGNILNVMDGLPRP